jgi:surfeit locus 1 family protein
MDPRLLQPKWLLAHTAVLAVVALFVWLGSWQLDRLEERRLENELGERRLNAEVSSLEVAVETTEDLDSLRYRRVTVTGEFDPTNELLIRSQVHQGSAGFHVITPLVPMRDGIVSGEAVLVNRGWIPLTLDEVPVTEAPPPSGVVTVEGWVELSRSRPMFGPEDPAEGRVSTLSRVDIDRIQLQIPDPLLPVYIVQLVKRDAELPVPVDPPDFEDQGPHLAYAIQWFGFAAVGLIGYYFLARRRLRSG